MYQLIYTSAPRLLEAGKTGFGTVARSRQMPQPLVGYVERISSFDRAVGVPSYLVYSCFVMGELRYHVFSRVADCGVDYTKRTNHIAQHWVMQEDDIPGDLLLNGTPAAVLLALQEHWLSSWQEPPHWFDAAFEIPLPLPASAGSWAQLTGSNENQRWLAIPEADSGINLCLPENCTEETMLHLLHEASCQRADHGWGLGVVSVATGTISRRICPVVCVHSRQQEMGGSSAAGYTNIQIAPGLVPPAEIPEAFPACMAMAEPPDFSAEPLPPPPLDVPPPLEVPGLSPEPEKKSGGRKHSHLVAALGVCVVVALLCALVWYTRDSGDEPASKAPPAKQEPAPVQVPEPEPAVKESDEEDESAVKAQETDSLLRESDSAVSDGQTVDAFDVVEQSEDSSKLPDPPEPDDVEQKQDADAQAAPSSPAADKAPVVPLSVEKNTKAPVEDFSLPLSKLKPIAEWVPAEDSPQYVRCIIRVSCAKLSDVFAESRPMLRGYNLYYGREELRSDKVSDYVDLGVDAPAELEAAYRQLRDAKEACSQAYNLLPKNIKGKVKKRPDESLEELQAQKAELAGKKKGKKKEIKELENQIKKVNQYVACRQAEQQTEEAYNAALNRIIREGCIEVSCGKPIGRTIDVKINIRL